MHISVITAPERVATGVEVGSKKRAIEMLSELLASADPELGQSEVYAGLLGREKLGSTGLGHGVALPHARLDNCRNPIGAMIRLAEPIDFDAADGQPVDMLFSMVVPGESTEEHLQLLGQLAEMFSDAAYCSLLRAAEEPPALLRLIRDWKPGNGAA